jgi:hypothetical protein
MVDRIGQRDGLGFDDYRANKFLILVINVTFKFDFQKNGVNNLKL